MAIQSFADKGTEDIAHAENTKAARKTLAHNMHRTALEKLVLLNAASTLADLMSWPSLRLEKLKGGRRGQHSIRSNDQHRVYFRWSQPDAWDVEIVDYH